MTLTRAELHDLTGYRMPKQQIAWLRANGFVFRVAADGYPRVDRGHYLRVMGAEPGAGGAHRPTAPDFEALRSGRQAA